MTKDQLLIRKLHHECPENPLALIQKAIEAARTYRNSSLERVLLQYADLQLAKLLLSTDRSINRHLRHYMDNITALTRSSNNTPQTVRSPALSIASTPKIIDLHLTDFSCLTIMGWAVVEGKSPELVDGLCVSLSSKRVIVPARIFVLSKIEINEHSHYRINFIVHIDMSPSAQLCFTCNYLRVEFSFEGNADAYPRSLTDIQRLKLFSLSTRKHNNKKVIVAISHDLLNCGAPNSLRQLVCGFQKYYDYSVIVISPKDGPLRRIYEDNNIPVIIHPSFRFYQPSLVEWLRECTEIQRTLNSLSPSIAIVNTLQCYSSVIACSLLAIPSIFIPRESESPYHITRSQTPECVVLFLMSIYLSTKTVFVANETRKRWEKRLGSITSKRLSTIHNAIITDELGSNCRIESKADIRLHLGVTASSFTFLCIGTICARKRQLDIIKAYERLHALLDNAIDIQLILVGLELNQYSNDLRAFLSTIPHSVSSTVFLFPSTATPGDPIVALCYKAADVFVLSSEFESFPRVILEAMSFALPVISTKCFGVLEMLACHEALFYDTGDVTQLALHMLLISTNKSLQKRLSIVTSRAFKRLCTYEQMINSYERIISGILA